MDAKIKLAKNFLEALRNGEYDKLFSYLSEDVHIVGASGTHYGKPELRQYFSHPGKPFKDVVQEPVGEYVSGNIAIIETVMKATHIGTYNGVPASNKPFAMPTLHVFEIVEGEIIAWRQYQNNKILMDLNNP
jgi:steroid delta-isomerase-like uncharacterized protein